MGSNSRPVGLEIPYFTFSAGGSRGRGERWVGKAVGGGGKRSMENYKVI